MKYKAILFDLDGTLLDSVPAILQSNREVCKTMGIHYDETKMRNWIGIPLAVQAQKLLPGREQEFMDNYRKVYINYQSLDTHVFPGTMEMLEELRQQGRRLAVVTSKNARGTKRVTEASGLDGRFDLVITAEDVTHPKPHPEPILKALEYLDLNVDEALYVGDSLYDIECAQRAGVPVVAVTWGARSRGDLMMMCPDAVFDAWDEFLEWLGS